jgi:hypothetical protein
LDLRRTLLRVLGLALLMSGSFAALSGIVGMGNEAGPVETILMFLAAAGLVVLGWLAWDRAPSLAGRSRDV